MGFNQQKCGLIGISHDFTIEIETPELEGCPSWMCSKAGLDNDPSDQFVVHDEGVTKSMPSVVVAPKIPIFGIHSNSWLNLLFWGFFIMLYHVESLLIELYPLVI